MRLDAIHDGAPVLRLSGVTEVHASSRIAPKSPPRIADGDSVRFESVYISTLPRVPVTEAHRRLESLRRELVAGMTDVPIHFSDPRIVRSPNPYAPAEAAVLKFTPNPADHNAAATERQTNLALS